jgi:hypothetical protein
MSFTFLYVHKNYVRGTLDVLHYRQNISVLIYQVPDYQVIC